MAPMLASPTHCAAMVREAANHKSEQLLPIVPHSPGFLLIIARPPYPAVGCNSFLDWKHPPPPQQTHQPANRCRGGQALARREKIRCVHHVLQSRLSNHQPTDCRLTLELHESFWIDPTPSFCSYHLFLGQRKAREHVERGVVVKKGKVTTCLSWPLSNLFLPSHPWQTMSSFIQPPSLPHLAANASLRTAIDALE
jgi:hypothetical protein